MTKVDVYKMNGEKNGDIQLPANIFGIEANKSLLFQSVVSQMSNARLGNAHAKTRSEVSGGGKKPWKQKGTGNARAGSSRSPIWIGGGVTFGPRNARNWVKRMPKKMRRISIFAALSAKNKDKKVILVDKIEFTKVKTKLAEEFLQKLPIKEGTILIIIPKSDRNVELSMRNLPYVKILLVTCLNIYDILKYDWIITSEQAVKELEKLYFEKDTKKSAALEAKSDEKGSKKKNTVIEKQVRKPKAEHKADSQPKVSKS